MIFGKKTDMSADNLNRFMAADGVTRGVQTYAFTVVRDGKDKWHILGPAAAGVKIKTTTDKTAEIGITGAPKLALDNCACMGAVRLDLGALECTPGPCIVVIR